ncbi:unnamed protein product [Rotaria magnacalcarata]|uniref:Uncharacterized protein n=2 Tax=Rotaria magnacalcarata TaxID=392030 RepID=A0A816Q0X0_9BILA|nr:unnamed protein product [Rotaria magnacalcarata]
MKSSGVQWSPGDEEEKKKKKCRGNRKARRLRRRERERQQQQQQVTNNANQTEQSVLIIIDDNDDPEGEEQRLKPSYLKGSDEIFKRFLSNAIKEGDQIVQYSDTDEKLQFVRQMTEETNNLYYIDLQRQLWQDHVNLDMQKHSWAPRVLKTFAKQHYTCLTYDDFPKHIVEQRQKTILRQFQQTTNQLQHYTMELEQTVKTPPPKKSIFVKKLKIELTPWGDSPCFALSESL